MSSTAAPSPAHTYGGPEPAILPDLQRPRAPPYCPAAASARTLMRIVWSQTAVARLINEELNLKTDVTTNVEKYAKMDVFVQVTF